MPAMNSGGSASKKKKEDVAEKVREIKQRQLNWLKQREQTKQSEELGTKPKAHQSTGQAKQAQAQRVVQNVKKLQTNAFCEKNTTNVKDKFKNWRESRLQHKQSKDDTDFNDCTSIRSGAESELERLISPELETLREPVREENFEDLANQIAERVKGDLGLEKDILHISPISSSAQYVTDEEESTSDNNTWSSSRCKTFTQEVPSFNHLGTSGLTSHTCTICKKLMLSSRNIPMMIIPCGHTLCKSCSDRRSNCPSCDCPVVSLTVNLMLQQVIQEYHSSSKPPDSHRDLTVHEDITANMLSPGGKVYSAGKYVEDNRRNKMASYRSQLLTLQTRHEVLTKEHSSLSDKHNKVKHSLHHEQAQVQNISKQEADVSKAISELQERLAALKDHRQHYEERVKELQDEGCEVDGKITLLSTTLGSLSREIEKVKLLAESEGDS